MCSYCIARFLKQRQRALFFKQKVLRRLRELQYETSSVVDNNCKDIACVCAPKTFHNI